MTKTLIGYRVDGDVYQVAERMAEAGIPGEYPADWYEYEVSLECNGRVVASWDSLTETYNGVQRLTEEQAQAAIEKIKADVAAGKVADWFSL